MIEKSQLVTFEIQLFSKYQHPRPLLIFRIQTNLFPYQTNDLNLIEKSQLVIFDTTFFTKHQKHDHLRNNLRLNQIYDSGPSLKDIDHFISTLDM